MAAKFQPQKGRGLSVANSSIYCSAHPNVQLEAQANAPHQSWHSGSALSGMD